MKTTRKLILSFAFAFTILCSLTMFGDSPAKIQASAEADGYYTYSVLNDEATITACDSSISGDVEIPDEFDGYPVTSIGEFAFENCTKLTSITIPDSVTNIGYYAFYGCIGLTSVTIPNSVTGIDEYAFKDCRYLTSVTLPDGITSIDEGTFSGCSRLTSITIPESVTEIGWHAFSGCKSLASVTISDSVTNIGSYAFYECIGLENVKIGNGVTTIDDFAFFGCKGLKSIVIPGNVTKIGWHAFRECTGLVSMTISDGVESIGCSSFEGCVGLTSVTIPDSVTSIREYAFRDCSNLKEITILNAGCEIIRSYDDNTFPSKTVIKGHTKSTAQTYASLCGNPFDALDPHTHSYTSKVTKAATCAKEGVKTYTCSCGDSYTESIKATGKHTYKDVITKATLTANGKITPTCSVCSAKKTATTIYYPKTFKLSKTSYTYDGEVKKPTVTVTDSNSKAVASSNYTVSYSANKSIGTATVKVTFKGNYSGSKSISFKIVPVGTSLGTLSAVSCGTTVNWTKQTSNTTGYQIQYATDSEFTSAKTKTVDKNTTTSVKLTGLKGYTKYYIRIRTFKTVKDVKYYSSWSKAKTVTTKPATGVTIVSKDISIYKGATKAISFVTYPADVTVKWTSADTKIATVSSAGKVKGVKAGTVKITGTVVYKNKTYKATCTVTVKNPSLKLDKTSATLYVGKVKKMYKNASVTLIATPTPSSATVTWTSSDSAVASVSSSGKVTAKKAGTAKITAKFTYGGSTYSKTCTITVKNKAGITVKNVGDLTDDTYYATTPYIEYTNNTNSKIKSIKFVTYYLDDEYYYVYDQEGYKGQDLYDKDGLAPGKTGEGAWGPIYTYNPVHGINIDKVVVTYDDDATETINVNTVYWDACCYSHVTK